MSITANWSYIVIEKKINVDSSKQSVLNVADISISVGCFFSSIGVNEILILSEAGKGPNKKLIV